MLMLIKQNKTLCQLKPLSLAAELQSGALSRAPYRSCRVSRTLDIPGGALKIRVRFPSKFGNFLSSSFPVRIASNGLLSNVSAPT